MTSLRSTLVLLALALFLDVAAGGRATAGPVKVITTISSYAPIARYIGGDKVDVRHIIKGYQDPHIVRPKPSLARELATADLLVATGLDLEMWLPALMDAAGNRKIMSGQIGYVAASAGVPLIERPAALDRSEGDVHVYGNPHIHTSPLNGKIIAENIAIGLRKVAPQHADYFHANLRRFKDEIDRRLFGAELLAVLGSKTLCSLAEKGKLHEFLSGRSYRGKPLLSLLGGWMRAPALLLELLQGHDTPPFFREEGVELLRAAAGQDFGYRPDRDPVHNRAALGSIRVWAARSTPSSRPAAF
jgi:hypothetical protein